MKSKLSILKIGGSVITDKSEGAFEKLEEKNMIELCKAISEHWQGLVVIHGAGSFGHPHVKKFGLSSLGAARVHLACLRLNEKFCSTLAEFDVPVYPIHPLESYSSEIVERALKYGFLPVLHGDVILTSEGIKVLSGDDLATHLAEKLKADKIGFATDVEGIYDEKGKVMEVANRSEIERLLSKRGGLEKKEDVTGGMFRKLIKVCEMGHRCKVFVFKGNYENLKKFFRDEKVGTEVIL